MQKENHDHLKWLLSVTHFTKHAPKGDFLMKWYADLGWDKAEEVKKTRGIEGSEIHRLQAAMDTGDTIETKYLSPEIVRHLMTYGNWYQDWKPEFLTAEETVFNLDEGVAGTLDKRYLLPRETVEEKVKELRGKITGDFLHVVHDTKTGKNLYPENFIQAAKYADLRNSMGIDPDAGVPVEWTALLRTNSKHKRGYEFVLEPLCGKRIEVFNALKVVVDYLYPETEPKFPTPLPREISLDLPQPSFDPERL